jgi:hypothetical protein
VQTVRCRAVTDPSFPSDDVAATEPRRRRVPVFVLLAAAAVLLVAVSVAVTLWLGRGPAAETGRSSFDVSGDLVLPDDGFAWDTIDKTCKGGRGFADVGPGTQVVVMDSAGKTLAVGALSTSTITTGADGRLTGCSFSFAVRGVPGGHQVYRIAVGRRGHLEYTADQLRGRLRLTLA